jgi:hypothetical protein
VGGEGERGRERGRGGKRERGRAFLTQHSTLHTSKAPELLSEEKNEFSQTWYYTFELSELRTQNLTINT